MTPRIAVLACVALFTASLAAPSASAEPPTIYKWVDENGVAHYTTDRGRIPSEIGTRIERAPSAAAPAQALHPEDELRDAVRVRPRPGVAAAEPLSAPPPTPGPASAPPPVPTVAAPAPAPAPAPVASVPAGTEPASEPIATETYEDIPPPLATDTPDEVDPVSAPPPAPVAPLEPKQTAEVAKLDDQIEVLEAEIAEREEKLAALISTVDDQRTTPLVDDPKFREISQRLPKLQAELQTLRERRNEIQPPATP